MGTLYVCFEVSFRRFISSPVIPARFATVFDLFSAGSSGSVSLDSGHWPSIDKEFLAKQEINYVLVYAVEQGVFT